MAFDIGEYVVYGHSGVCRIEEIVTREFDGKRQDYYLLRPVPDSNATLFVPCDNEKLLSNMRRPLTCDEIDRLLSEVDERQIEWIEDKRDRNSFFRAIVHDGDIKQFLRTIRCIYLKKQELMNRNKVLPAADEKILQDCERLITNEFSFVLGIDADKVSGYISEKISSK